MTHGMPSPAVKTLERENGGKSLEVLGVLVYVLTWRDNPNVNEAEIYK